MDPADRAATVNLFAGGSGNQVWRWKLKDDTVTPSALLRPRRPSRDRYCALRRRNLTDRGGGARPRAAIVWSLGDEPTSQRLPHAGAVYSVAFSPDGKRLATIENGPQQWVRVWRVDSAPPAPPECSQQLDGRLCVVWYGANRIAVGSTDKRIHRFEVPRALRAGDTRTKKSSPNRRQTVARWRANDLRCRASECKT